MQGYILNISLTVFEKGVIQVHDILAIGSDNLVIVFSSHPTLGCYLGY